MRRASAFLARHDNAPGVPVDAVHQSRGKGVFRLGVVLPLVVEVVLHPGDEGVEVVVLVRVDDEPGLLVQQQQVLVLVDDGQLAGGF